MGVILELGDMEGFLGQEELEGRKARAEIGRAHV